MRSGERYDCQHVVFCFVHQRSLVGELASRRIGHAALLIAGGFGRFLNEHRADGRRDRASLGLSCMCQGVAHEVPPAAALSIFDTTALMPSWLSLIHLLAPLRPRRFRLRRNSVQKGSASEAPTFKPSTSRWPSVLTLSATITDTLTMRPASRFLT
jgi:hypothetical protein